MLKERQLFLMLAGFCLAGLCWLGLMHSNPGWLHNESVSPCLIKQATGFPCPSCGTTRSMAYLVDGNIPEALYYNPLGIVVTIVMACTLLLLAADPLGKKGYLVKSFRHIEGLIRRKMIAIPFILLILVNWTWNIYKGL